MSIDVLFEMLTAVGAPLLVNVAVPSGTTGVELQLVPVVHSLPAPTQVPSTACAGPTPRRYETSSTCRPRHTLQRQTDRHSGSGRIRLDCMCFPRTHPRNARDAPQRPDGRIVPWKKVSGNGSSLGTQRGRGILYKSILAISEGGPDAEMSFRLAARIAALFDGTVDAVHFAEHQAHEADITVQSMPFLRGCPTIG